jgi:Spy/CpxP family protein refolding chaperone
MGYRIIVNSVGANLTAEQKARLRKVLEDRKRKLQTALAEVEQGLRQLRSAGKKSKRKAAKRRG